MQSFLRRPFERAMIISAVLLKAASQSSQSSLDTAALFYVTCSRLYSLEQLPQQGSWDSGFSQRCNAKMLKQLTRNVMQIQRYFLFMCRSQLSPDLLSACQKTIADKRQIQSNLPSEHTLRRAFSRTMQGTSPILWRTWQSFLKSQASQTSECCSPTIVEVLHKVFSCRTRHITSSGRLPDGGRWGLKGLIKIIMLVNVTQLQEFGK